MSTVDIRKWAMPVAIVLVASLAVIAPLFAILMGPQDSDEDANESAIITGDGGLSDVSRQEWIDHLSKGGDITTTEPKVDLQWGDPRDVTPLDDLGDLEPDTDNMTYETGGDKNAPPTAGGAESDTSSDMNEDGRSSEDERELEESDIIKHLGDRLYILNPYIGLVIVDVADPKDPQVIGRLSVQGYPVSMFIVDFLAFVLVSSPYDPYGNEQGPQGALHIISIIDPSEPGYVETIPLSGYPLDSRRVGEVIYIVSNEHGWYDRPMVEAIGVDADTGDVVEKETTVVTEEGSGEGSSPSEVEEEIPSERTEVVSISFSDPQAMGEVDRVSFSGTSSNIHVSKTALFVSRYDYEGDGPRTELTYVDISDPEGDIDVRGSITINGWLSDRYQMDHYEDHLRVVTQEWPRTWDSLPESTLYVISCSDPDRMRVVGDLLIDDAGNLMATRFAGDRGYTIHLPRGIDPLDVLDLSDPMNPELCDVLEMPGWVEHMEVIGYHIIAVGVDDSSGTSQVALTLFDVTDPYDAVLKKRVVMGEGYSYSQANWDPKALSLIQEKNMVLLPYSSYDAMWRSTDHIQIATYDLEEGNMDLRGSIPTEGPMSRTRMVGDSLMATSEMRLVSADVSDPDGPVIDAVIDLVHHHSDAAIRGGLIVSAVSPTWGSDQARIVAIDPDDPYVTAIEAEVEGLLHQDARISGDMGFIKGIRASETSANWEVHAFDVSDPSNGIGEIASVSIPITDLLDPYVGGYYKEYDDRSSGANTTVQIYYDPLSWTVLGDGTIVVWSWGGYRYWYPDETSNSMRAWVLDWGTAIPSVSALSLEGWYYIEKAFGDRDSVVLTTSTYDHRRDRYEQWTAMRFLDRVGGSYSMRDLSVPGSLAGLSSNLTLAYSTVSAYIPERGTVSALLTYNIEGEGARLLDSTEVPSYSYPVLVTDSLIVMTEGGGWWYYDGIRVGAEEGYDIAVDSSEDEKVSSSGPYVPETPTTRLTTISLVQGVPYKAKDLTIKGYYYKVDIEGGLFLAGSGVLVGFTVSQGSLQNAGSWSITGYVTGGEYLGGGGVASLGLYGLKVL